MSQIRQTPEIREFLDDHFGMFVHWGLYSVLAGEWKDRWLSEGELGEWIMLHLRIPRDEYEKFIPCLNPAPDFAEQWVLAARKAGVRYLVFTTMHHDGFCLFRTGVNDYNAWDRLGRDLVGEVALACRKHGMKLGFYYSHTLDWSERDALGTRTASGYPAKDGNTWDFPGEDDRQYSRFLYGKVFPQIRELLTGYGDVTLLWFDYPHNITPDQCRELYDLVKSIQPRCLVNSRIGNFPPDYYDLGDNQIPTVPMGVPAECLVTLNDTWGYRRDDDNWKTPDQIIGMLVRSAASGANLLMNIGPRGDGVMTPETQDILMGVANWTDRNREAVYGTRQNPFKATFDWGYVTEKQNCLYLYMNDNRSRSVTLNGLLSDVEAVSAVAGGEEVPFTQKDEQGTRSLIMMIPDAPWEMPVYRVRCRAPLAVDGRIFDHGGTLTLYPLWAGKYRQQDGEDRPETLRLENNVHDSRNGKCGLAVNRAGITSGWTGSDEFLSWEAFVTEAGLYELHLLTLPGGHIGHPLCGVTVDIEGPGGDVRTLTADVLREAFRYRLSSTGQDNLRIGLSCGRVALPQAGPYHFRLRRLHTHEIPLPMICLQLKKQS